MTLFTIGHSTRALDEFGRLLQANNVDLVADVRTVPGSRRVPHFAKASLAAELPLMGIEYVHLSESGGLRKVKADSINTGWRRVSAGTLTTCRQTLLKRDSSSCWRWLRGTR